jgi:branched-chain amino acid transport system ATP-binding protein
MTALLEVKGLTSAYETAPVVVDVNLTLQEGMAIGVLGANGAGKSSLLRTLSGVLKARAGSILWEGEEIRRRPPWWRARAGIAHVQEGRRLFSTMTVEENLVLGSLANSKDRANVNSAYELFPKLFDRRLQKAGTLSGGEQQMVAIGRAVVARPKLILIDEMSAGLAPVIADHLIKSLAVIRDGGTSLLIVEQAPELLSNTIDEAIVLKRGRIERSGRLEDFDVDVFQDLYLGVASSTGSRMHLRSDQSSEEK